MDSLNDELAADAPVALPVISGAQWFGPAPRPFLLRVELPLTLEEMVAALYGVVQSGTCTLSAGPASNHAVIRTHSLPFHPGLVGDGPRRGLVQHRVDASGSRSGAVGSPR